MIKAVKVKPIKEIFYCDDCKCPVIYTELVKLGLPPKYTHRCTNCNKEYDLQFIYPKINYIEIGGDEV